MIDDRQIAIRALQLISPNRAADYESWIAVGMALHNAGCSVDDWANWCPDGKTNHLSECIKKWSSFTTNGSGKKVTVGLLVKWARDDSGLDPIEQVKAETDVTFDLNRSFEIEEPGGWKPGYDLLTFVKAVFRKGDKIGFNTNFWLNVDKWQPSDVGVFGMDYDFFLDEIQRAGPLEAIGGAYTVEAGVWCKVNPLDGEGMKTGNVVEFRHVVVESDTMPKEQQLAIIEELKIPCVSVVDTGGRSIHAIVKIDAGKNRDIYDKRVKFLFETLKSRGFEVDNMCRNPAHGSRFPGFMRGDRRQFLVSTNIGCSSWGEWEDHITKRNTNALSINKLMRVDFTADDDSIIGNRFVCRGAPWMIVSRSGIGKSSLLMQIAINFGLGREIFGLPPKKPLRSLIVQAENANIDIAEPVQGVIRSMSLSPADIEMVNNNVIIVSEDTHFGEDFCRWLDKTITAYTPLDLVWIDPLLAYVGADTKDQGDMSMFLRNWMNPVLHKHGVGLAIVHHTGKVKKQAHNDEYDLEYIGAGSAELTNWPRAVTVLEKISSAPVIVNLKHPKRGNRLERRDVVIQHSTDGNMRWIECDLSDDYLCGEAEKMPPLKDSAFATAGILKWMLEHLHITEEKARKLRDEWRKAASRNSTIGPWERLPGEGGKWIYQGRKQVTNQVLELTEEFVADELP